MLAVPYLLGVSQAGGLSTRQPWWLLGVRGRGLPRRGVGRWPSCWTRAQVRRAGTNANQAVRALNTTGEPQEILARAVVVTAYAVEQLDRAAAELVLRLP